MEAIEWHRDDAQEALDTEGWCPMEGKGKRGSKRVHVDSAYALRTLSFSVFFQLWVRVHSLGS